MLVRSSHVVKALRRRPEQRIKIRSTSDRTGYELHFDCFCTHIHLLLIIYELLHVLLHLSLLYDFVTDKLLAFSFTLAVTVGPQVPG